LGEEKEALIGNWSAIGNVLRAKNQYNLITGDQLGARKWRIGRVCRRHHCRLVFARETSYRPLVATLSRQSDHSVARFAQRIPNANGESEIECSV
jgi:hypothetical protein